jgi:hypothetical protein
MYIFYKTSVLYVDEKITGSLLQASRWERYFTDLKICYNYNYNYIT